MSGAAQAGAGERFFARYAHPPNALGYCGPAAAAVLRDAAAGRPVASRDVRAAATRFSGAWPYQQLIGELLGLDPLSEAVGRAYWLGEAPMDEIDPARFGEQLLHRLGPRAGHYWAHLTPELLPEATPTHAFHVLGVYPWTRLLTIDAAAALSVLDGCRIRVGEVTAVGARLSVSVDSLTWDGRALGLAAPAPQQVDVTAGGLGGRLAPGDLVAVHWDIACDALRPESARALRALTRRQLALANIRLARAGDGSAPATA